MPPVTNIKLTDITLEYNSFVDSQVLTAKQLNDIVEFFEDQQRLTRTCLIGVGLVCGLSFKGDANGITIGKGCGVTTDGDLLYMPETTYKNFRAYDNSLIKYPPFYPLGTDAAQMALWELVTPDDKGVFPTDSFDLTNFKAKAGKDLTEMYGLLYLEYYSKDPDACTAIDCDNQGRKQVAKPKVLLIAQADMNQIIEQTGSEVIYDDIYKKYFNAYNAYFDAPVLAAKRVFFNTQTTATSSALTAAFSSIANTGAAGLSAAIQSLYNTFKFALDPQSVYPITSIVANINTTLSKATAPMQAQYLYDFYKDLLTGYNELRAVLSDIIYQCCPNIYAFPKHIMLGALNVTPTAKPTPYRHKFYASPAVSANKDKLNIALNLLDRLNIMSSGFTLPANPVVKVTPSTDNSKPLEARAIPFYYGKPVDLAKKWSYGRWLQGTDKLILSYNASAYSPANDVVVNPLNYSIDSNNFFRIEGHIGKKYTEALAAVDKIRQDSNLPFDVVTIRLGDVTLADINIDDYACQFNDLEATLKAFQAEQNCLYSDVSKFFSSFDTKTGYSVAYNSVLAQAAGQQLSFANAEAEAPQAAAPAAATPKMKMAAVTVEKAAGISTGVSMEATSGLAINKSISRVAIDSGFSAVDNNINVAQGSIGYYVDQIRRQGGAVSISDYADAAGKSVDTSATGSYEQAVAVDIPVRVIAGTRNISQWLPDRLVDIDQDTIDNFSARIDDLCNEVKSATQKSRQIFAQADYIRKGYEDDYELQLWRLSENCCAGQALAVIMNEIQDRKTKLLQQLTFSAYAANHTGLEHLAGVPAGGTFVMVYATTMTTPSPTVPTNTLSLDDRLKVLQANPQFVKGFASDADAMTFIAQNTNFDDISAAVKFYQVQSPRKFTPTIEADVISKTQALAVDLGKVRAVATNPDVPEDIVFADFCLPYMCCSDCPPVSFIMPKPPVGLSLPKAVACSDEGLLQFKVSPVDGVIKAAAGFETTVVTKDAINYFDTTKVKDGTFGQQIKFTVNDQPADCTITVFKHPAVTPAAQVTGTDPASVGVTIKLSATTNQATGDTFAYTWTMPDGQVHPNLTVPDDSITYLYADLRQKFPDGKLTFTLSANNHDCTDTEQVVLTVQIPDEPVNLTLAASEVCSDGGNINFTTVQPATGIITSKLAGDAVKLLGSQWVVDPSKGPYDVSINDFMVNGKPVPACTLMIHEHPQASFDYKVDADPAKGTATVTLTNKTPNPGSFKFTWTFDDGTTSNDVNTVKVFNMGQFPRGRNTVITLTAVNGKFDKCRAVFTPTPPVALPATVTIPILTNLPPAGTTATTATTPPQILVVKDTPPAATTVTPKIDPAVIKETPAVTPTVTPKVDPAVIKETPAVTPAATPKVDPSVVKKETTITPAATPKVDPATTKQDPAATPTVTPKIDPKIIKKDPGTTDPGTVK
ncbi:hypothetical protein SAMN05192574_10489 [Mucilaginibacter gossypiicola]|uniref:PKD domain-containing protein n=1 Tax=Mucilaginibacter gossypiicola TaxID=551995 RepID=A0A1H8J915_9SPHI|nr:hypothetical protein [Mucilaginibacter gossypiicola]SEN77091.1 hypothetical protein SAMN05192574_10489 [Mucilaginibacter gossypiicola]